MNTKKLFCFIIHTGEFDTQGERVISFMGGGVLPDGPDRVWMRGPNGNKLFSVERSRVESISREKFAQMLIHESRRKSEQSKAAAN